ncbi:MAG: PASTA domain-containing protein [Armatimonadota bacterium]|nr:PASTA domain-containing protein [Armatimonadota bacterium]
MIGRIINYRYEVLEKVGDGPLFSVYRARDKVLNKVVALKVMHKDFASNREFAAAVEASYRDAARLAHPNIARILDADSSGEECIVACEFVRGISVQDRVKRAGPVSVALALDVGIAVLEALEYAHELGVVHGDIKPSDIIVGSDGEIKLTDFGLARALADFPVVYDQLQSFSIHYQAPEVVEGNTPTPASDIYAVGVVLYQMLTNALPFDGGTIASIALKKVKESPVPPRSINAAVPKSLNDIILKAIEPSADHRYKSVSAMLAELRALREALRLGKPVPVAETAQAAPAAQQEPEVETETLSRSYWWWLGLFVVAVLVSLGLTMLVVGQRAQIQVPQFLGLTWEEAQKLAEERGIELIDDGRAYSDTYEAGKICSAVPPAGTMVPKNRAQVRVKISLGPSTVEVPDLTGMTEADANEAAVKAGFTIGKVRQAYSDKVPINAVISQDPEPGARRPPGTAIDLVISQGPKPVPQSVEEPTTQDVGEERRFSVSIEVPSDAEGAQEVLIKVIDADGERVAYQELHDPGDNFTTSVVARGSNIRIKVYVGGVLVKDVTYK